MNLRIIEDTDDLLLLELVGSLDLEGVREIETVLLAHLTFAKRPVILDFSQVTFLASFGMRMLFEAIRALGRQGKQLAILNAAADGGAGPRTRRRKFSCSYLIRWSRCPFEAALACLTAATFQTHVRARREEDQPKPWQTMSLQKEFGLTENPRGWRFHKDPAGS